MIKIGITGALASGKIYVGKQVCDLISNLLLLDSVTPS